jgi:hypothetical protein
MELHVRYTEKKSVKINVQPQDTIADIKEIFIKHGYVKDKKKLKLTYNGQELQDNETIGSYNIPESSVIEINPRYISLSIYPLTVMLFGILSFASGIWYVVSEQDTIGRKISGATTAVLGLSALLNTLTGALTYLNNPTIEGLEKNSVLSTEQR